MSSQYSRRFGLTAVLLLVVLQACLAAPAYAAQPATHLVINEIQWADASDQWVELSNPSDQPVDFSVTPYTLKTPMGNVTVSTGKVEPKGTIILSKLDPSNSKSSLASGLNVSVQPTLALPVGPGAYTLLNGTAAVDTANSDVVAPFAGRGRSASNQDVASEYRVDPTVSGNTPAAWATAQVTGKSVKPFAAVLATPGQLGVTVPAALTSANLAVTTDPLRPTVTVAGPTGIQADVLFTDTSAAPIKGVGNVQSGFTPESPLVAGHTYMVSARSQADGVYSAPLMVTLPTGSGAMYAPVAAFATLVASKVPSSTVPVLAAYPATTNKHSIDLSGTVPAGTQLVVAINGTYQASQSIATDQTAFQFAISLVTNSSNRIEVRFKAADGTLSAPVTAMVNQIIQAPRPVDASLVKVASEGASGMPGAATAKDLVAFYADTALTQKLAEAMVAPDGSFGLTSLGQMAALTLYVVQTDAAGNASPVVQVANPVQISGKDLNIPVAFSGIGTDAVSLRLQPISGAMGYLLKYRTVDGQFSAPMMVCADTNTSCDLRKSIVGLTPGTAYVFAVAAVDGQGQASNYTQAAFQTLQMLPPNIGGPTEPLTPLPTPQPVQQATAALTPLPVPAVVAQAPAAQAAPVLVPYVAPQAAPTPKAVITTPAPASEATPSPEAGAVESATIQARNWTPWIVLGILIGLAFLATAGYFYWFGGEAGAAADALANPRGENQLPPAKEVGTVKEPLEKEKEKTKRW